jgi:hypothetical protein
MGHKLITTTINPNRICKSMIIPALVCQTNVSFERSGFLYCSVVVLAHLKDKPLMLRHSPDALPP